MKKVILLLFLGLFVLAGMHSAAAAEQTEIVVVGAGGAGLTAAIEARTLGADVILLEKMAFVGGSTVISGGATIAVESSIHDSQGVTATADDLYDFLMEQADYEANSDFVRRLAETSGSTIDKLVDLGAPYVLDFAASGNPYSDKEFMLRVNGGGSGLVASLHEIAVEQGIDVRVSSPAIGLLADEDGVYGVTVDGPDGEYEIHADKVILATGSIAGNYELMAELALPFLNNLNLTGRGNTGDGMVWARELGADVVGRGVMGIRGVNEGYGYYGDIGGLVYGSGLYVNLNGERFANERMFYPEFHVEINKQPGKITYVIFDQNTYVEALDQAVEEGLAYKADTLEELAMRASIVPDTFVQTVEEYNQFAADGEDKAFGSPADRMTPAIEGPFYAVICRPAIIGTFPAIKVDADGRVVDADGSAIPNLLAAGDLILGNVFMDTYPTSGGGVGIAVSSGRLAGMTAVEELER